MNESTTKITAEFSKDRFSMFCDKIEKLNKFFVKKGLDGFSYEITKEFTKEEKVKEPFNMFESVEGVRYIMVQVPYVEVTVNIPIPEFQLKGFKYIASISNREGSAAIFSNGVEDVSQKYNTDLDFKCGHCHSGGYRVFKAIFENETTGQVLEIGSKCAKEYFGIDFLGKIQKLIDFVNYFEKEERGYREGCGKYYCDVAKIITYSVWTINHDKFYISQKKVNQWYIDHNIDLEYDGPRNDGPVSTSSKVSGLYFDFENPSKYNDDTRKEFNDFYQSHYLRIKEDIEKVMNFWSSMTPDNDFEFNIKNAYMAEKNNRIGLIAYGVWHVLRDRYIKAYEEEKANKPKKEEPVIINDVIGSEKEKKVSDVELIFTTTYTNSYGIGNMYKFRTSDGYLLVYFSSKTLCDEKAITEYQKDHPNNMVDIKNFEIVVGWKGTIKYTVKGKNEYKGQISTVITRGSVINK